MLLGRKLLNFYNAKLKLIKIEERINEINQRFIDTSNKRQELLTKIADLKAKPQNEDILIEIALTEQELFLLNKDNEREEPKLRGENFSLLNDKLNLEQLINDAKANVSDDYWQEYNRISENVKNPVVEVKHQMCTGCFIQLSMPTLNKWRSGKNLVKCDVCGRILA